MLNSDASESAATTPGSSSGHFFELPGTEDPEA